MKNVEPLLKNKLTPEFVPEDVLNQSIVKQAKEMTDMKRKTWKSGVAAAAIAGVLVVGSVSAYAAYQYLKPSQVADRIYENSRLAEVFEQADGENVKETQITAGYEVTFLGMVTGKDLIGAVEDAEAAAELNGEKTYAVTAIRKADGTPMPSVSENDYQIFCVSPLIHGKTFMEVNNGTLNAGITSFVQDGVQYELLECDNLEMFADRGVSLGVVESFGSEIDAFQYDETTGCYTRTAAYEGINALFELPLDPEKADPTKAEAYFERLNVPKEEEAEEESLTGNPEADRWLAQVQNAEHSNAAAWSEVEQCAAEKTASTQTILPDAEGYVYYQTEDGESTNCCYVGDWTYEAGVEAFTGAESDGTLEGTLFQTMTKNEDGTFTIRYYEPKN